jgi:hypothetical protein
VSDDGPVRVSADLERILGLRRRVLDFEAPEVLQLARDWSRQLLNPKGQALFDQIDGMPEPTRAAEFARIAKKRDKGGENCPLLMSGAQAVMLYEAYHLDVELRAEGLAGGLFASAGVGTGKTFVSAMLALILGAAVPLLLVPGGLERKTHDDFTDLFRYWLAPRPSPQVLTFEKLQHPKHAQILCNCKACQRTPTEPDERGGIRPTHVFVDESDGFNRTSSARTRRLGRYMSKHPATFYAGMTGTAWNHSINDAAPQLIWALKTRAPVPLSYVERQRWSQALDSQTRSAPRDPGALTWLMDVDPVKVETYDERLTLAREGFKRRLLETPGVIQTKGQSCDQPLTLRFLKAPDDPILDQAFHHFRKTQTTLDGWDVDDPLTGLAYATQMSTGFYYAWDPRPPIEWTDARSAAARFVREKIASSGRHGPPLDSRFQVYDAFPNEPVLLHWQAMEPTFPINVVARPLTASVLAYAAAWMKVNGPGLVWVQYDYVGKALSAMTGVPFFGSKGKDPTGLYIEKYPSSKSAILSVKANGRGRNLQSWSRCLVLGPPSSPKDWEQAICGRPHRQGQDQPVWIDVVVSCAENIRAVEQARDNSDWQDETVGTVPKLLIANFDWSHFPAAELENLPEEHPSRARWRRAA